MRMKETVRAKLRQMAFNAKDEGAGPSAGAIKGGTKKGGKKPEYLQPLYISKMAR